MGDSEDEEEESGSEGDTEADSEDEDVDDGIKADGTVDVHDQTGANLVNLRRTIYLTIMSALDFEEAVHKLLKIQLGPGQEVSQYNGSVVLCHRLLIPGEQREMCNMIIECCSQERTFSKFYGLMGERFCKLNPTWASCYEECFAMYYDTIHRYETNRLRNIARFFGHLLMTDGIGWTVLEHIKMNEDDTTSSSRIFVKIMFQEVTEGMVVPRVERRAAAGLVVTAAGLGGMTATDESLFRGAARTALRTGVAVSVRYGADAVGDLGIVLDEGLPAHRVVVGGLDRKDAVADDAPLQIARRGAYVAIDHVGTQGDACVTDDERADLVIELVGAGHRDRVLLSSSSIGVAKGQPDHDVPFG